MHFIINVVEFLLNLAIRYVEFPSYVLRPSIQQKSNLVRFFKCL